MTLLIRLVAVAAAVVVVWRFSRADPLRGRRRWVGRSASRGHHSPEFRLLDAPDDGERIVARGHSRRAVVAAPHIPTWSGMESTGHSKALAPGRSHTATAELVRAIGTHPVVLFRGAPDPRHRLDHHATIWCVPHGDVWLVSALGNASDVEVALDSLPLGAARLPVTDHACKLVLDGPRGVEEVDLAGIVTPARSSVGRLTVSPVEDRARDGWMALHSVTATCFAAVVVHWSALGPPDRLREPGRRLYERMRRIGRALVAQDDGQSAVRALETWASELVGGSSGAVVAGVEDGQLFVSASDTIELADGFDHRLVTEDGITRLRTREPVQVRLPRFSEQAIRLTASDDS